MIKLFGGMFKCENMGQIFAKRWNWGTFLARDIHPSGGRVYFIWRSQLEMLNSKGNDEKGGKGWEYNDLEGYLDQ